MTTGSQTVEQLAVNTIRTLSIDSIEKANSGHPGMPMGAAPMGYVLWTQSMKHNPANPQWFNRDRFVLSAGHGSMLLYSLLHLCGYDLPLSELQNFRQWGSKTPGHPEFGHTPGVDATTGPLGQGIAMAVGMAMAEAHLAATYNTAAHRIVDHMTYAICGDGDLMEGVAAEAASMAGHLKLGKLVVLYDSNDISLDGDLHVSFSENVEQRFNSYGWQVLHVADGNDLGAISAALQAAQQDTTRPTLIEVKTVIGYGSPNKAGKGGHVGPHGSPLGKDETVLTKQTYGWPTDQPFYIPEEVKTHFAAVKAAGAAAEQAWNAQLDAYRAAEPQLAAQLEQAIAGQLPTGWDADLPTYEPGSAKVSTRVASGAAINALAPRVPALFGGSADLASSNNTTIKGADIFSATRYGGRNIWFGVREFAMAAAVNGMGLHGALKPFGATFFVFSDYLRPAVRLAALMQLPVTFIFTHDSIAVGEDGPTHEPIEHLAAMRVIPGLTVIRPADANETIAAWRYAVTNSGGPVALVLTRQNLAVLQGTGDVAQLAQGAYVVAGAEYAQPQAQILATGSEVSLAIEAQQALAAEGITVRVINMPSLELFARQPQADRDAVILPNVKARLAIEMGHPFGWERFVGDGGSILGIDHFGASAPGERIMKEFGFSVENVVARVKALL